MDRIVHGEEVRLGEWPFLAVLDLNGTYPGCTGTLIRSNVVLTAANCFANASEAPKEVMIGGVTLSNTNEFDIRRIEQVYVHAFYNNSDQSYPNDIALVMLDENSTKKPVSVNTDPSVEDAPQGIILGWGATQDGGNRSHVLRKGVVDIVPFADCLSFWNPPIFPANICAGLMRNRSGACRESGGPLLVDKEGEWVLIGVESWRSVTCGDPCLPDGYIQLSAYRCWIPWVLQNKFHLPAFEDQCEGFTEALFPPSSHDGIIGSDKSCAAGDSIPSSPPGSAGATPLPSPGMAGRTEPPGVSPGAVAGIVIGTLLAVALTISVAFILVKRSRQGLSHTNTVREESTDVVDENEMSYIRSGISAMDGFPRISEFPPMLEGAGDRV